MAERRRSHPVLNGQVALFGALALGGGIATWWLRGPDVFVDTVLSSGILLIEIIPIVVAAMMIGGYSQALVPQDRVARWLGAKSGIRGILLATAAGAITPGGPFASFALVVALARSGADIGACVTYLTAWSVLGMHRLVQWELPLLGPDLAILRLAVSIPLPIIAGIAARALVRWLSPWRPEDETLAMLAAAITVWIITIAIVAYAAKYKPAAHRPALMSTLDFIKQIAARMPLAILAAGFLGAILPRDFVALILGQDSGFAGIALATVLGGLLPGGPMVTFPVVISVIQAGAGTAQTIALLTAWSVYAFHRILAFEWPMLGWRFVLFRMVISIALPPIAALLAALWAGHV